MESTVRAGAPSSPWPSPMLLEQQYLSTTQQLVSNWQEMEPPIAKDCSDPSTICENCWKQTLTSSDLKGQYENIIIKRSNHLERILPDIMSLYMFSRTVLLSTAEFILYFNFLVNIRLIILLQYGLFVLSFTRKSISFYEYSFFCFFLPMHK